MNFNTFIKIRMMSYIPILYLTLLNPEDPAVIEKYRLGEKDEKNQGRTVKKIKNNIRFVNWCINAIVAFGADTMIMYIDGPERRTTRMLIDAGINPKNLIPVNDNETTATSLKELAINTIHAPFNKAVDQLTADMIERIRIVWYDGCSTIAGGKNSYYPLDDIDKLLSKILHNIILSVTFCGRMNRERNEETARLLRCSVEDLEYSDTEVEDNVKTCKKRRRRNTYEPRKKSLKIVCQEIDN